jgi:hypothetical protein
MIGSLIYLMASKPNIMFFICLYARYHGNVKESNLITLKRILRYIESTLNLGLWYSREIKLDFIDFTDVNFTSDRLVSWYSK